MEVHLRRSRSPYEPLSNRRRTASGACGEKLVTGHEAVGNQAPRGNLDTGITMKLRTNQKIGTWNVRGLLDPGKLTILEREITRNGMNICGLSETHWQNSGHILTDSHVVYFSGNESTSRNGVAFIISKHQNNCVIGYEPVSDRIICLKLRATPVDLNLIQVYAPTSTSSDEVIEDFYTALETTIAKIPNREILLILGDFNAKIGAKSGQLGDCVGNFGLGKRNERGERLIQFASENNFTITNSCFQHHHRRLYTWTSPDGKHRNQIDYILIRRRWRTSVQNTHTLPGADCGSDHQLLMSKLRVKLRAIRIKKPQKRLEVQDTRKFLKSVENNWEKWTTAEHREETINTLWDQAKQLISNAVEDSNPPVTKHKRQHWMTDVTLSLIDERREKKATGCDVKDLNRLSSQIQAHCRRDHNTYLNSICNEIETHAVKYESKDLYRKIRFITKSLSPKSWAIEDNGGKIVTELDKISESWKTYCQSLFQDQQSRNFSPTEPHKGELEPDILLSEVKAAIKHLKDKKAAGRDGIPIETIKALGEYGTRIFHTICNKIWQTGVWPTEWTHTILTPLHKKGSAKKCGNYRLIALISHASKILLHILNERLKSYLSREIAPEQAGFVKGKGTREQILIVRQVVEKAREFNKPVYICFVDFSKAFDSVKWPVLWNT